MNKQAIKTIAIGSDHGGFALKEKLKIYLSDQGYDLTDCGTSGTESVDYPKYAYIPEPLAHFLAHPDSITIGAGLSGKGQILSDAYAHAQKYFLEYSRLPPATRWENLSHFVRWNYKSHVLTKQTCKKIGKFLRRHIQSFLK